MRAIYNVVMALVLGMGLVAARPQGKTADGSANSAADAQVLKFLEKMRGKWHDMNVPEADGRILHDLIVKNKFKSALEIGTSTGHSAIWMGWALRKTGGKLLTLEIDEGRLQQAVLNFKEAGVAEQIEARLADAHVEVGKLTGPYDFVFIDADKDWYTNYARAIISLLTPTGCIVAHNVWEPRAGSSRRGPSGTAEYYEYMKTQKDFQTYIHPEGLNGVAVSCREKS